MNLTALQHSPFLQSLGWAIANSLWQAAALWIAYVLVNGVYKSSSAKFKNNFSTILISLAFVCFCITLFNKYFALQNLSGKYEVQFYQAGNNTVSTYNWNAFLNEIGWVLPYLSVAYLFLLIFLSLRLINIYRFTRFVKSNGLQKPAVEWKLFAEKVSRHMGITRKIKLWISHHIDVPATIGFIKPVILIPLASVNQLSPAQLEAIILHELSHIKRNDYLINLFISIIETILFFNPFVVLLAKIIKRERENCCDDFVIQYQYDRHAYASALLSLEQFRNMNFRLAIGATSGKKHLMVRIKRIMEINSNTNFNYGQKLAALLLITGIICSVAWLSPQSGENKIQPLSKNYNKVSDTKIDRSEKPEVFFLNENNNKIKSVSVKLQTKKELTKAERELKELRDLNLNEIANREYNRQNLLLQESKKEISNKKIEKFNRNKFFIAGGMPSTPALFFDDETFMLSNRLSLNNPELNAQQVYVTEFKKLQTEWDKAQFSFSIDCDKMRDVMKEVFDQKQLLQLQQKLKDAAINKLIKIHVLNSGERVIRPARVNTTSKASGGSNGTTFYFVDSLAAVAVRAISHLLQTQVPAKAPASIENKPKEANRAPAYVYTYGYGGSTNNENKTNRNSTIIYKRSDRSEVKRAPVSPDVRGVRYRLIPKSDNDPTRIYKPKSTTAGKDNIHIEYRNGVVYINGKEMELPDTNEMLAQVLLKGKKLQSKVKNIHVEIND